MSQEEKKQTAPETEAAAEKPETPAQEAPEKEAPQTEEKNEGKHDCKHHHHETAALQAKLEAEEKKNADLKNQLLRTAAEYDNYRKRTTKEKDALYQDAKADTIKAFLAVYDNLERAVAAPGDEDSPHKKGLEMIFHQYQDILKNLGVTEIEAQGQPFDPEKHNAVMHIEDETYGESVVAQVFQAGFMLGDKVIRHAIVQVAN